MKFGMDNNFGTLSIFYTLVFAIDKLFVNYSCDMDVSNMAKSQ